MRLLVSLSIAMLALYTVALLSQPGRGGVNTAPLPSAVKDAPPKAHDLGHGHGVPAPPRPASRSRHTEPPSRLDLLDWHRLRTCESGGDYSADTGNGYYGAYQFDLSTWRSVGGTGNPADASREEQDYRALLLYLRRGTQPWPVCGGLL